MRQPHLNLNKYLSIFFFYLCREPYDHNPVLISTLNIIKGFPIPVDLVRIETQSEVCRIAIFFPIDFFLLSVKHSDS